MKNKEATAADKQQEALEEIRRKLLAELVRSADHIDTLEDGYRMTLHHKHTDLVMKLEDAERSCCQFLTFEIAFPAGIDTITVTVTGPAGTREFLDQLVKRKK
jgi:hypothetical protein